MTQAIIEGTRGFYLPAPLNLIDTGIEVAYAGRHPAVRTRPDFSWVQANLCEAGPPNENGHLFGLDDLRAKHATVRDTALNMGHRRHHVTGVTVASELVTPDPAAAAGGGSKLAYPYVDIVAAFWKYRFPLEHAAVEAAFKEGTAHVSMEAVPATLTCATNGCCGETFDYDGVQSDSYCESMRAPRGPKRLDDPHFIGTGLIIPPMLPGWKQADITQYAAKIELHEDEADAVYRAIADGSPGLSHKQWELLMAMVIDDAFPGDVEAAAPKVRRDRGLTFAQESERIAQNKQTPPAQAPHEFQPAVWTHPNGHPRCILCGGEETTTGYCPGAGTGPGPVSPDITAADWPFGQETDADYSRAKRDEAAKHGWALANGSFPIFPDTAAADIADAVRLVGFGKDPAAAKRHIIKRARATGHLDLIPESWMPKAPAKADAPMNGGMICLYPDDANGLAERTTGYDGADPAAELHVTLAYVAEDVDQLSDDQRVVLANAARAGAAVRNDPLELTVVGYGTLGSADPPATVLFLQQTGPTAPQDGAGAIADRVRAVLNDYGSEAWPDEHDLFICHMTLGYGVDLEAAAQFAGETITFSRGVTTHLGDESTDYPWGGDA